MATKRTRRSIANSDREREKAALMLVKQFVENYAGNKETFLGNGYARQWLERAKALVDP